MSRAAEEWLGAHPLPIAGRRAAVLGATGSLGREIARDLARMGARVTLLARDMPKAERLADELRKTGAEIDVEYVDLARLETVRDYAERERRRGEPITALLLIAGVFRKPGRVTPDGYETHYQVNFLGPAALALLLAPSLAPDARGGDDEPRGVSRAGGRAKPAIAGRGERHPRVRAL